MNVAHLFEEQALRTPDALALHHEGGRLRYGELLDLARRFRGLLAARGVGREARVAVLLPNDPAFAVALLGVLGRGAVAVVLSPAWAPADAARALHEADAALLVTTHELARAVGAEAGRTLTVDDGPAMGSFGAALRAQPAPGPGDLPAARDAGDVATILFSSGTTGDPKGVMLTHGNLAFNAAAKIRYCGIGPADRLAMVVPMAHCFGQNVILLAALLAGASVRLYPRFDAERVGAGIRQGEVTMLLAAPAAFARLLALDDATMVAPLRYALSAAAPLPAGLAARWRAVAGRPLAQGYGLTECSPFAVYDAAVPDTGRRVGRAIDGVEVRVIAADGDWARAGGAGEVAIRGPNVMAGYWRRPEATAAVLRDGWLRTGDVGLLDDEGALHLIDRMDDVINVAGFKAWPSDVERALLGHPAVREAAAFAIPDAVRGAAVGAAVVLHDGASATSEEIIASVADALSGYQRPALLRVVESLPRSASGKVLRRTLAAEHSADAHGLARPLA